MHIRKLEISGFKSFVDKSVIHFDHDVIGIVGPNGCGKSNIVDAIRWCMGEQSAKHLRGRAMEDVIFNGSESRPQHGMAEVTLTFDNSDREYALTLPEEYREYPEIAVTRRLYRDGTSEYAINKTNVRLRDVTDLFLGTGVGTKAYSIVEQGRIGQIVSSRPADRRLYIEEAAGITKYKLRRKQAERKLDLTKQNLLRVTDIVNEIDRTRSALKRQAAKAERYVKYREELEDLFLHDAAHRLLEMIVVEKARARQHESLMKRSASLSTELEAGEANLNAARGEASGIEGRYEQATSWAASSEQRVTEARSAVARAHDRVGHLEQRLTQLEQERVDLDERLANLKVEGQTLGQRIEELGHDEASRGTEAQSETDQLASLRAAEQAAEAAAVALRQQASSQKTEMASNEARRESLEQRVAELDQRRAAAEGEREQKAAQLQTLQDELAQLQSRAAELEAEHQAAKAEADTARSLVHEQRQALKDAQRHLEQLRSDLSHKRSRLTVLEDLHRRLEGVGAGTKALLSSKDPAVVGLLADRIEVSESYTDAFAALLGDRLQCVIVRDPARGLELLDELKRNNRGRATIATSHAGFIAGSRSGAERDELVLTRLIDQVRFAPEDEPLLLALVGDAVVVRSAADALALNAKFPGATAVALDGTVVREDGLVSGGRGDDVAAAMLEQKREMRELAEEIEQRGAELWAEEERCAELERSVGESDTQLQQTLASLHQRELAAVTIRGDVANRSKEVAQVQARCTELERDATGLAEKLAQSTEELQSCTARLEVLSTERETTDAQLAEAEQKAFTCKEQTTTQAELATQRQVRLAQVREQLESARHSLGRVQNDSAAVTTRLERVVVEWRDAAHQLGEAAAHWLAGNEASINARAESEEAQQGLDEVRRLLDEVRTGLREHEGSLRQLRVDLSEVDEQSRSSEMTLQKLQLEREHLLGNVAERFRGLNLSRVVGDYHARPAPDAEHRRRIDELTKLIDRMGPVNLDAKEEYEDAERRYAELSTQRDDIQLALDELDRAIRHMDRESKRRFRETFDTVNDLFKKTFSRLFKGGRGELVLTDPDNILETGVDIIAQPPGKKLGNIELMSGGEKALTATALIFAIFQHRPSPFCILDEVDAPLDDANVGRYNEAVRAMTSNSQFIVITHIKKTMQSVDVLYGVTMGEPGVSRVVSVKVNEEAKARSQKSGSALDAPKSASADSATQVA